MAENEEKKIISSVTTIVLLLIVLLLSLYSMGLTLGWFANNKTVTGKDESGIALHDYTHPSATLWTYNTDSEVTSPETAGWVKHPEEDVEVGSAVTVMPSTGLKTGTLSIKNLQFGTIDNLVKIKKDNTVYLRFEVKPEAAGDPFHLWATTQRKEYEEGNAYPFTIYTNEGVTVTPGTSTDSASYKAYEGVRIIVEGDGTDVAAKPLFRYYYGYSKTKYDVADFDADNFSGFTALTNTVNAGNSETDTTFKELSEFSITTEDTDTYYVYLKIQPDLSTFAKIAEPLTRNGYMPCFLLYDFTIFHTVKPID